MIQGALVGFIGTLIGVVGGVRWRSTSASSCRSSSALFSVQFLDKSVYYISELPSDLQRGDVIAIAAIALVLALLATHLSELARGQGQSRRGAAL